jgi:hypothetical protein
MKIKSLLLMTVLAVSGVATSAIASVPTPTPTNYYFGDVTNKSVSASDAQGNNGLGYFTVTGNFTDNLNFSVSQPVIGSGFAFELQAPGLSNINGMSVSLIDSTDHIISSFPDVGSSSGPSAFYGSGLLATGSYYFQITGIATTSTAKYSFSAATAPVPEPETWAMLLCGIGLVGLQLRKRHAESGKISLD